MMEDVIRLLTHDNDEFDSQWDDTKDKLSQLDERQNVSAIVDALAEYVLQESHPSSELKFQLLSVVINALNGKESEQIDHVCRVLIRVLDQGQINLWHLAFLKELYRHFQLGKYLPQRTPLVEELLSTLQKHAFPCTSIDEATLQFWRNDVFNDHLLNEKSVQTSRDKFQQLCRFAISHSSSSSFWSAIATHLLKNISDVFDSYVNVTDAQFDLDLYCTTERADYKKLILYNFSDQVNLFKTNYNHILLTMERLLVTNNLDDAQTFFKSILIKHSTSIPDLQPLLQLFIRVSPNVSSEQREEYTTNILFNFTYKLKDMKVTKKLWPLCFELATIALGLHTLKGPECAEQLLKRDNFYPWKELGERLIHIIDLCASYDDFVLSEQSIFSELDSLEGILTIIYDRVNVNNTFLRETHSHALKYTLRWSSSSSPPQQWPIHVYRMGKLMIDLIDPQQMTLETLFQLLQRLDHRLQLEDDVDETLGLEHQFLICFTSHLGIYMQTLQTLSLSIHRVLNSIFLTTLSRPLENEDGTASFEQNIFQLLWSKFLETLTTEEEARIYEPAVSKLHTVARSEAAEETLMFQWWFAFWNTNGLRFPHIADNHLGTLLSEFIDREQIDFVNLLQNLYPTRPEPFHARVDDLIHIAFPSNRSAYLILLQAISRLHPEIISSTHIDYVFTSMSTRIPKFTDAELHGVFQFLTPVASVHPERFDKHRQELIRMATETQNSTVVQCLQQYFISSTIVHGEKVASEYLAQLICLLQQQKNFTQENRSVLIHACELIGIRHKHVLEEKRSDFVKLDCSELVHFIDNNKMTEEYQQVLEQSRQEIEAMEKRVRKTETDVQQTQVTAKRQELKITNIRAHVNTLDGRLQDVTERVDIHQKDIERIDAKTLSFVPVWAGDICKLLNRRAPNDWRLLGRRFGYSASELKHWATQFDPSMALLNEWYMTHKADEATFGLIKTLEAIGRQDAVEIIRKAITDAGETIPEAIDGIDIHRLPPVFISYQWNTQPMVTQLKGRLEEAGYSCWMDIGQMGGGIELHSKIDKGIRGAKVILCCMNNAYATSDACIGQVNLAVSTGKPLIPLQMEKQAWPPEGPLGPLMSEYLFIRFFDRKSTNDPNFWPNERFTELLGQIRYYAAPDPDMISERYKNWFVPRSENLIFLKDSSSTVGQTTQAQNVVNIPMVVSQPQVMISYQWDRQSDIIDLYKRLTELGYRIWLDIFQMGGGDSLFAKIDAGIRNAQCILACVTPKYTLSANCRREMSLADALGKPIVPLLLEQLNENWPLIGPMSLVFTDKLYIDFRTRQKQDVWQGKEYDQILVKLKQYVPEVQTENSNRHLVDMARPASGVRLDQTLTTPALPLKRRGSAPVVPQSRACSIM